MLWFYPIRTPFLADIKSYIQVSLCQFLYYGVFSSNHVLSVRESFCGLGYNLYLICWNESIGSLVHSTLQLSNCCMGSLNKTCAYQWSPRLLQVEQPRHLAIPLEVILHHLFVYHHYWNPNRHVSKWKLLWNRNNGWPVVFWIFTHDSVFCRFLRPFLIKTEWHHKAS